MRSLSVSLLVALLVVGEARDVRAERPAAPAFNAADYGLTLGLGALALTVDLWGPPDIARWQSGILMDDDVRGGLPRRDVQVVVTDSYGRGSVSVVQQPSSSNGYTAVIRVNDPRSGYGAYRFDVSWRDTYSSRR